jgi:pimeloyl-ACP methyl ester carboxylesterase
MSPEADHFVIGYSLGGRVALHLDPNRYQKLFLLSVHPGLQSGRSERLEQDEAWAQRLLDQDEKTWLEAWNGQAVFQGDLNRPQRQIQASRRVWAHLLRHGSLGHQNPQWDKIKTMAQQIFWLVGTRDEKFLALKSDWLKVLPADHVVEIAGAGHGLVFEAPAKVARVLRPWLEGDVG